MTTGKITVREGQGAPLRVAPSVDAALIGAVPADTVVSLIGYGDGWYFVEADGLRGYIAGSMVQTLDGIGELGKLKIKKMKKAAPKGSKKASKEVVEKVTLEPKKGSNLAKKVNAAVKQAANNALSAGNKAKANGKTAKVNNKAKGVKNTSAAAKNAAKKNVNSAMQQVKKAATATNPKTQAETRLKQAIKNAKKQGVTEDEIKQMAALNGLGNLTDLQGLDGGLLDKVKNVAQKVGSGVKNAVQKVTGAAKKTADTANAVNAAAMAIQQQQQQQQASASASEQPAVQPEIVSQTQNINTMTEETKSKIKKFAIAGAALVGVATVGVIIYNKKKKQNAPASNGKGALNGVKKRRKSKKSKKNTGNKMLNLK